MAKYMYVYVEYVFMWILGLEFLDFVHCVTSSVSILFPGYKRPYGEKSDEKAKNGLWK
jgi:hypothetical protein